MASVARMSGPVLHLERKSGTFEGRDWAFTEATILVANRQTVVVRLGEHLLPPSTGDVVDYVVEVTAGRGDNVKIRAVDTFPVYESLS